MGVTNYLLSGMILQVGKSLGGGKIRPTGGGNIWHDEICIQVIKSLMVPIPSPKLTVFTPENGPGPKKKLFTIRPKQLGMVSMS